MKKNLKKEQVQLLRFEKELLGLGAGVAALTAGAGAGAEKVVGELASQQVANIQQAYLDLVETVQAAHNAVEASAAAAGAHFIQASGTPKNTALLEMAKSVIGIG